MKTVRTGQDARLGLSQVLSDQLIVDIVRAFGDLRSSNTSELQTHGDIVKVCAASSGMDTYVLDGSEVRRSSTSRRRCND